MNFFQSLWRILFGSSSAKTTTTTTKPLYPTDIITNPTDIITNTGDKMKKAFCFSINDYSGERNDLQGCNNDSLNWANLLSSQYGFQVTRIIDSAVTRSAVMKGMTNLIVNSKIGDSLVFTYSGHGTSVVDPTKDEEDGKDEAICLYDGFLVDDEIRDIFNKLPNGVKLTFISDSCHSGTVTRAFLSAMNDFSFISIPKYLPPKDNTMATQLSELPAFKAFGYPEGDMNHVLIAGCADSEYSYDANIGGSPTGAFSYYAIQVLKNNPKITYKDFYSELKKVLPSSSYPQSPQLEGSQILKDSIMFE
jgi:hypothetical protein